MRHLTPLLAAAALLVSGGYSYAADETVPGIALLAAGLIVLGAWLSAEVRKTQIDDEKKPKEV